MSKPPGVTLLDHRRPALLHTYPDTRRRAVTRLTALFRRQTGLYRARARTAAASKQRSPLIKPSTNDYYLRSPDGWSRRRAGLDKSYRGFTRLHTQAAEISIFPAMNVSPLHVIYRSIAAHLWMGWRDGCERRTTVKTKTISAALQAANAPVGVHKIAGVAGLYLKVGEAGAGSYFYRYRLGDRRREIGLGSRDKVSLADACKAAKAWAVLRDEGHDPIETRRRERADNLAKSRAQHPITFEQMAGTYLRAHGASWKHRYAKASWWNPLAKFAFPIIGGLSLDEIEISHITAIMLRAERAGAPDTARRVRSRIELVLNAAIAQGLRTATSINPAGGKLIAAAHPSKRKGDWPHHRAVKIDDAQEVFRALKAEEGSAFGAPLTASWSRRSRQMRALFEAVVDLAVDDAKPVTDKGMETTLRHMPEMTRNAEHEIHAVVLACTRARRQMLARMPTSKPTVH
jgi:hypothetical protein